VIIPVRVDPAIRPHVALRGKEVVGRNPVARNYCPVCDCLIGSGPVSLVLVGRDPESERGWTAMAVAVHDACADLGPEAVDDPA
jgi:hypothetical protein